MYRLKKSFVLAIVFIISISIIRCTKSPEGIVAKVNKEEITKEDYETYLQIRKNIFEKENQELDLEENILEEIILETIILQKAKDKDIIASDEEVEKTINKDIEEIGSKEELIKELDSIGVSFDYYEAFIGKQIILEKYKEFVMKDIDINTHNVKKYFKENKSDLKMVKISHILVNNEEEGKEILKRLEDDEKFSDLALEKSIDSISGIKGGELGYISKNSLKDKEVEEVIFKMKEKEISELIKTENGYEIIYIEDIKDDYEDLKDEIRNLLKEEEYKKHIQKLQKETKIRIYLD